MLRHPSVVLVLNILFVVVGAIFFLLLIGLNYEQRGWLKTMNELKLLTWILLDMILVYMSTFIDYRWRPWILILYLVAAIFLLRYPLLRERRLATVPVTKSD